MSEKPKTAGWDSVKDSGIREEFKTGSKRDTSIGKGRYDLLPFYAIHRLARVYENGAIKYGENNWRLGQPCSRYLNSALRHLMKAGGGWRDEDHLGQAMWNVAAIIETQKMIELGNAPKELDDLTYYTPAWEEGGTPTPTQPVFPETLQDVQFEYNKPKNQSRVLLMCNKIVCLIKSLFSKQKRKVPQYC